MRLSMPCVRLSASYGMLPRWISHDGFPTMEPLYAIQYSHRKLLSFSFSRKLEAGHDVTHKVLAMGSRR